MPKLSIILPTYNRHHLLDSTLSCLTEQTFRDFEVIIVNDAGESVQSVVEKWSNKLNIKYIDLPNRGGPSTSRNHAISISEGEYLSFLDDDDIYLPNHLNNLINELEKGNVDFVYSGAIISPIRLTNLPEKLDQCIVMNNSFNPLFLHVMCYIPVASIVCRNFKNRGIKFNEQLSFCEDWEMWVHLFSEGYVFKNIQEITAIYHRIPVSDHASVGATLSTETYEKIIQSWRKVVDLYPIENSLVELYRGYVSQFHQASLKKLAKNEQLEHFSFERFTKYLLEQFNDENCIENISEIINDFL